ncbi:MAG: [FeFe] hydrogenase, group A [Candidatus Cloacimonetes bacterium]|jgi:NADH-quinone oxidoreductase subunit G|nr:[FeFe] hydrogenase, group A [Candidatus Cloacimonadota bacterium]MDY0299003.1 [FeFe] hydrogenase, group A [Candidatus Cloacimonadaceae bacterium]MCK9332378.1 [FeFe] hydrogenase, group A [Candidatus Cloacimonadota bacterium]MDD2210063.1 [FeFe] hydrogenase, group A [Candidatus Cloacimonadota bacterium]MDD3283193.1 [FeFe] hydrogenase, group A [Candidatus Cloacimonadota bacterium]
MERYVYINDRPILWEDEKNILELAHKAHIDIPTFCYHSELSLYGACRLCMVEVEGRGLVTSCSTAPSEGMRIKTHTEQILKLRKIIVEMLLANHDQECPKCSRANDCKLRDLSNKLSIDKVRFRKTRQAKPMDLGSECLVRDPSKCVLCGDCVRYCSEIQGIGAIDFASRGQNVNVAAAYGKSLAQVDCINCGQCAAVCPTGAIVVRSHIPQTWKAIHDPSKTVVAQIAPAVRVALGEMFNLPANDNTTGKMVAALRMIGFDQVYDTAFAADLTVVEEANEFITRKSKGEKLPIFTSCCPAWVKYAEQSYPQLLGNLSSCRSPQQMFGSIAKERLPELLKVDKKDLVVVSIMPCTAKKYECKRPEFIHDGIADVDIAITTQELGRMIKEAGINFDALEPESMDLPMGFATGAGMIFGNSGGVSEAVLRYAADKFQIPVPETIVLQEVRGESGLREASLADGNLKMAVVHGIKNAQELCEKILAGEANYDIVEVMACPGGCIGGAGQPIVIDHNKRKKRTTSLYHADKTMPMHRAQDNPFIGELYNTLLKKPNSHTAHELLHTAFQHRKRIDDDELSFSGAGSEDRCKIRVCVGTSCYLRGSQDILAKTLQMVEKNAWAAHFDIAATFCSEKCDKGPNVIIGDQVIHKATLEQVKDLITKEAEKRLK